MVALTTTNCTDALAKPFAEAVKGLPKASMKPTKLPGLALLLLMLCQMLFPTAMLPAFAGPLLELLWHRLGWPGFVPVNLLASALLLGLMATIYWQTLAPLGRLLQRRETRILAVITVEVE
jgi:hypothetical protein